MKAIVQDRYGPPDVLRIGEIDTPVVDDDSVLVRVRAASINALDWRVMRASPFVVRFAGGLLRPKLRPGSDVAGVVEAVGKNVTHVKPGDEVFGALGDEGAGACAEFVTGKTVVPKPRNLSFEEAAAVPVAAITALQAIRDKGAVRAGQSVAVYGAGGGVGTFTVQIAKVFGAKVTAMTSTDKVELVRSLGADHVLDYTRDDFASKRYDVFVDVSGTPSLSACRRALAPGGIAVLVGGGSGPSGPLGRFAVAVLRSTVLRQPLKVLAAKESKEDLLTLKEMIEAGSVKPVIDKTYDLAETAAAMTYLETGKVAGKVVITI